MNTSVTVMWDRAVSPSGCGPVFYYTVTVMNSSFVNNTDTQHTRADFSNLINGTKYNISVVAVNRAGPGPSSMITVTTTDTEGKIIMFSVHNSTTVFLIRSYGTPRVLFGQVL